MGEFDKLAAGKVALRMGWPDSLDVIPVFRLAFHTEEYSTAVNKFLEKVRQRNT